MNRTSGWSRKASWIALRDRGTAALGCREGEIMTFDYCSPAELFTAKRKGGSHQRLGYRRFATGAETIRFVEVSRYAAVLDVAGLANRTMLILLRD